MNFKKTKKGKISKAQRYIKTCNNPIRFSNKLNTTPKKAAKKKVTKTKSVKAINSSVARLFTKPKSKAYDQINWVKRDSELKNPFTGEMVFQQKDVEIPSSWSMNALNIVAQKYFTGTPDTKGREASLKDLIDRVVDTVVRQGVQEGYFENATDAENYREELKYVLATQRAAFNSPVWFNIGAAERSQQASACFILAVEDTMPSILDWYKEEGMIFKGGSGSGLNVSSIRSSFEPLGKSAGTSSGPLSFMRGADSSAGAIKSGGKTRRAAPDAPCYPCRIHVPRPCRNSLRAT